MSNLICWYAISRSQTHTHKCSFVKPEVGLHTLRPNTLAQAITLRTYSEGVRLESQPEHRIFMRFFVVSLSHSRKILSYFFKLDDDSLVPHPSIFIIRWSPPPIRHHVVWAADSVLDLLKHSESLRPLTAESFPSRHLQTLKVEGAPTLTEDHTDWGCVWQHSVERISIPKWGGSNMELLE
jgi:hypothetical protein